MCSTKGKISEDTYKNTVELTKKLMKKYNIPASRVVRHWDVCNKVCPGWSGWTNKNDKIWKKFKKDIQTTYSTSSTSTSNQAKKKIVLNGQKAANKFVGCNIVINGICGNETKKAAVKVVQTALNKDYGTKLTIDGIWGSATDKAFGSHYVKVGEKQWLVTALEILCSLKGKDPKGIEYPGTFGNGLKTACGASKAVKSTFKNLCS